MKQTVISQQSLIIIVTFLVHSSVDSRRFFTGLGILLARQSCPAKPESLRKKGASYHDLHKNMGQSTIRSFRAAVTVCRSLTSGWLCHAQALLRYDLLVSAIVSLITSQARGVIARAMSGFTLDLSVKALGANRTARGMSRYIALSRCSIIQDELLTSALVCCCCCSQAKARELVARAMPLGNPTQLCVQARSKIAEPNSTGRSRRSMLLL